jgi:hypothetical protein
MKRSTFFLRLGFWLALLPLALFACADDDDDDAASDDDADDDDDAVDDDSVSPDDDTDDDDDDDDSTPWPPEDLIEEGKLWLHYGDGDRANLYFRQALEQVPGHPEANYGLVVGNDLHVLDVYSVLIDYVDSLIDNGGPVKDDPDNLLDSFIDEVFNGLLYASAREQMQYVDICLEAGHTFHMDDAIPVILHFELVAEMVGDFEAAELHGSLVPTLLLWGVLGQLDAVSLDLDITLAASLIELDWSGDLLGSLRILVDVLQTMLTDPSYPDFLTLPVENIPQLQEAALYLAESMNRILLTLDAIEAEEGDQSTDVIGYDDLNGNQRFDPNEPYKLPGFGSLDDETMEIVAAFRFVAEKLRNSLWDDTEFDIDPETRSPFNLSYLNPLLAAFGWPPLIPDWDLFDIDFGAMYADPGTDGLRRTLLLILQLAEIILDLIGPEAT